MSALSTMLLCTTFAGACILFGGLLARVERLNRRWLETEFRHTVIAFGGGVLISAVALVLVPEGNKYFPSHAGASVVLIAGGVVFFAIERYLGLHRRGAPQLMAMLLDFLPESLALGALFALGAPSAPMLALMIALQNLPEGFNAYRELGSLPAATPNRNLLFMAALIPLGPLFGMLGWLHLVDNTELLGGIMLFASGGILYLLFQDVAPQAHLDRHWGPAIGAVLGFAFAMLGQLLVPAA